MTRKEFMQGTGLVCLFPALFKRRKLKALPIDDPPGRYVTYSGGSEERNFILPHLNGEDVKQMMLKIMKKPSSADELLDQWKQWEITR